MDWGVLAAAGTPTLMALAAAFRQALISRRERREPRFPIPIDAREAKRRAKRENERLKLLATFLNGTGIAILLSITILPIFRAFDADPAPLRWAVVVTGAGVALSLHAFGLWVLRFWRSED